MTTIVNRKADFFLQNESIRTTNRIDSNRELECSTTQSTAVEQNCVAKYLGFKILSVYTNKKYIKTFKTLKNIEIPILVFFIFLLFVM